jgi:hypothetical protein
MRATAATWAAIRMAMAKAALANKATKPLRAHRARRRDAAAV